LSISLDSSNIEDIDLEAKPKDTKYFITYIGKMSIMDAKSITLELCNNSFLYLSSLTITDKQLEILAINTTTSYYGSSRFYSIIINIGASNKSIVGYS
jgi:transcription elongation factor GreA-like protein